MRNTLFEEFCTPVSVVVMVALADDDEEEDYHGYLNDDEKNIMILQVTRVLQLRRKWLGCWSGCKKCRSCIVVQAGYLEHLEQFIRIN